MKTILPFIFSLLTALSGFSQVDTVRIAASTANSLFADLRDCDLARTQLSIYQKTDSLRIMEVANQTQKIEILQDKIERRKRWYNRPIVWTFIGFLGGVIVTK